MQDLKSRAGYSLWARAFACVLLMASATASADERPNIVLCMGDDHGWDETAYNGHPCLRTPVLDKMAKLGLRMDNFYSAHPSCSPTRGSIITGRHPVRYGTFAPNWSLRPEEISVAQLLSKAGYACGHFGKWHLGPVKADSPTSPGAMGFDEWLSHDNFFEINPTFSRNGGPSERHEGESSGLVIAEAIRFISKAKQNKKPFFTVVWFGSPHEPYSGLEKDLALYNDLPEVYGERTTRLTSMETGGSVTRPLDEVLRERYAEITAMDRAMGQLRQYLEDEGLKQNTVLWYCGDNGVPGGVSVTTPFRGAKGLVYEGGIRVPGLIEWPAGIPEPRVTKVNAVTTDMLPTLCDLAGLPLPARPLDGESLKPLIEGNMTTRARPICFWNYDTSREQNAEQEPYIDPELQQGTTPLVKLMGGIATRNFRNYHHPTVTEEDFAGPRAILGDRYKLVIDGERNSATEKELFDLRSDPAEESNLIETEVEIARELERQLRTWQESVLNSLTGADYR
jgi:arylsulfatase A-like enzyme